MELKTVLFIAVCIFLVGFSAIDFTKIERKICVGEMQGLLNCEEYVPTLTMFNSRYLECISSLTTKLDGERLIVSTGGPDLEFITKKKTKTLWGKKSKEEVVQYMSDANDKYLLVAHGISTVPDLKNLFNTSVVENLAPEFREIRNGTCGTKKISIFELVQNE